jgi:beta-N-acetylhexosaminidase
VRGFFLSVRDIRRHIGQLLLTGFEGPQLPPELRSLVREFDLGGVILFARNVESPEQVAELALSVEELKQELPLWVAVDQEGGRVARLREGFTRWPPMATLGRAQDEKLAARFARALAHELSAVGITLDFTPVLDVLTNPKNPGIGDRAFSDKAEDVARLGRVIIETLQSQGIAASGKHFPGHGEAGVDSHDEMPVCDLPPDRLQAVELVPFRAAIEARVAFMLTAHVLFPPLDEEHPATLSPRIVSGLLRQELKFEGAVLTDDLDMGAIAKKYPIDHAVVQAIAAGVDGLLICGPDYDKKATALEALIRAVEEETLPLKRVEDAIKRMRIAKERFLLGRRRWRVDPRNVRSAVGRMEHQAVAEEMSRWA